MLPALGSFILCLAAALQAPPPPQAAVQATPPKADKAASQDNSIGDLLVAPTRIVLEGRKRSEEITLVNIGPTTALYRISFTRMEMDEHGEFKELPEGAKGNFSDPMIRYSPRQVLLEPNVAQTIRIQLRKPADLAAGEYRSHMLFRAVPQTEEPATETTKPEAPNTFSIQIRPIYGITIPIIVRQGETKVKASLTGLKLEPGQPDALRFVINREGNQSSYGDIIVTHLPGAGLLKDEVVATAKGVGVYATISRREVRILLQPRKDKQPLKGGRLRVVYLNPETELPFAEAVLELP